MSGRKHRYADEVNPLDQVIAKPDAEAEAEITAELEGMQVEDSMQVLLDDPQDVQLNIAGLLEDCENSD